MTDARGGNIRRAGQDHAGLPDAGDVQTVDGRAGPVHVPTRHARPRTHSGPVRPLPIAVHSHQLVRQLVVPDPLHDVLAHLPSVQVSHYQLRPFLFWESAVLPNVFF